MIYDIDVKRRKKKQQFPLVSLCQLFHGPVGFRVKSKCSCLARCYHSLRLIMKAPYILQRTQWKGEGGMEGENVLALGAASYGKRCLLLNLGNCETFLKRYSSSLQLWSSYQITQVLVAGLWEQCTNTFSLFPYLLNLRFSSSSPPCCAFNLNLTETLDEFSNRHYWSSSPRKAFWIG